MSPLPEPSWVRTPSYKRPRSTSAPHFRVMTFRADGITRELSAQLTVFTWSMAVTYRHALGHRSPAAALQQLISFTRNPPGRESRAVFNGKVFVRHGAATIRRAATKQICCCRPSSRRYKAAARDFCDDVKCTHGARRGTDYEREVLSGESRDQSGLARNMLTYGFAGK